MSALEKKCLIALVIFTALAGAALAVPSLIVIGFFMLIVPGVVLSIAPPIALYGWLFAAPYGALRAFGLVWWCAAFVALAVACLFGFGWPAKSNAETRENLAQAIASDIRPQQPLPISGTVALVRDDKIGGRHEGDNSCDDLCLRLLYNGIAEIVYVGQLGRPGLAFAIERRTLCPPFELSQDVVKWHGWPSAARGSKDFDRPPPLGLKEVVEARVAGGECLVRIGGTIHPDWTIERIALPGEKRADPLSMEPRAAHGERITVYRRDGSVMQPEGRLIHAYASTLAMPLMPVTEGGFDNFRWTWSRSTNGESRWDWDSVTALRSLIAFNADLPDGTSPAQLRELLAAALSDPRRASDDAGLLLANSVMVDIARRETEPGDAALLARAIADDRLTKIEPRHEIAGKLGPGYARIVDSAIARLGRLPSSDATTFPDGPLSMIIAQMPNEWFASPPTTLITILRNPVIASRAERIISRLGAGGATAIPILTEIVTRGAEYASSMGGEGYDRRFSLEGVNAAVAAICRIGVPARSSLGPIVAANRKLIAASNGRPDRNPGKYSALWRGQTVDDGFVITLVSLGVPITEFRAPDQPSRTVNGSWQKRILLGVKNHECAL